MQKLNPKTTKIINQSPKLLTSHKKKMIHRRRQAKKPRATAGWASATPPTSRTWRSTSPRPNARAHLSQGRAASRSSSRPSTRMAPFRRPGERDPPFPRLWQNPRDGRLFSARRAGASTLIWTAPPALQNKSMHARSRSALAGFARMGDIDAFGAALRAAKGSGWFWVVLFD